MAQAMKLLSFIWQLPQNIVGLVIILFTSAKRVDFFIPYYKSPRMRGGISLGSFIIVDSSMQDFDTIAHEHGHQRQSLYLGPLYLLVIGLPSIVWAALHGTKLFPADKYNYYSFYTESWANKLGGLV